MLNDEGTCRTKCQGWREYAGDGSLRGKKNEREKKKLPKVIKDPLVKSATPTQEVGPFFRLFRKRMEGKRRNNMPIVSTTWKSSPGRWETSSLFLAAIKQPGVHEMHQRESKNRRHKCASLKEKMQREEQEEEKQNKKLSTRQRRVAAPFKTTR